MKKNKMMRLASFLLVATLLTTSMISGTFAKYVTEGSASDSARVAKFGVEVIANGDTFSDTYEGVGNWAGELTVNALADVVAPGTSGNMVSMTLKGQPEVAVKVSYEGHFKLNDKWVTDKGFYCPLVIKVGTEEITAVGKTQAEFEKAVNEAIAKCTAEYPPFTDLSTKAADSLDVSWEWPFEGDDAQDTYLGNEAAKDNAATVELAVTTTVTQID